MARLLDSFSALFAFGLGLAASLEAGTPVPTAAVARQRARGLLDAARAEALAAGRPAAQVESACFAAVAWFDELARRLPGGGVDDGPSLQSTLFNSSNAHTEFFHHLAALGADAPEVREVYWYALALGFRGQYYFENDDKGELGKLKFLHGQQLQTPPLTLDALGREHLTPQPYVAPDPPARVRSQRRRRALVQAGGALALLIPCGYLVHLLLGGLPASPPAPTHRVAQQLERYACADLTLATGADGASHVRGFVSSTEDVARVRKEVEALPDIKAPDFDLRIRAWPYCEVAAILKPYQARNRDSRAGLQVQAPSAHDGRLREGDAVRIEATGPAYPSHLRVDYYTSDGAVLHLTQQASRTPLGARQSIPLGRDMPSSWLVSPPFGTVLVAVVASPAPFTGLADRPPFELASAYLAALRESLASNPGGARLVADFLFLETVAR